LFEIYQILCSRMPWEGRHSPFWKPIPPDKHPSNVYRFSILLDWVKYYFCKPFWMLYPHRASLGQRSNLSFFSRYCGKYLKALHKLLFLYFTISGVVSMAHIPIIVQAKHIYIIISWIGI